MKKMNFMELANEFYAHNEANNVTSQFKDKAPLIGVVVFQQGPWFNAEYTEAERTYRFSSDNKYFISGMGGNSIFANCDDGKEKGVRLDWYIHEWKVDYCYIEQPVDK